jgi:hypothetical protein
MDFRKESNEGYAFVNMTSLEVIAGQDGPPWWPITSTGGVSRAGQHQDPRGPLRHSTTGLHSAKTQLVGRNPISIAFGVATDSHCQALPLAITKAE